MQSRNISHNASHRDMLEKYLSDPSLSQSEMLFKSAVDQYEKTLSENSNDEFMMSQILNFIKMSFTNPETDDCVKMLTDMVLTHLPVQYHFDSCFPLMSPSTPSSETSPNIPSSECSPLLVPMTNTKEISTPMRKKRKKTVSDYCSTIIFKDCCILLQFILRLYEDMFYFRKPFKSEQLRVFMFHF